MHARKTLRHAHAYTRGAGGDRWADTCEHGLSRTLLVVKPIILIYEVELDVKL